MDAVFVALIGLSLYVVAPIVIITIGYTVADLFARIKRRDTNTHN